MPRERQPKSTEKESIGELDDFCKECYNRLDMMICETHSKKTEVKFMYQAILFDLDGTLTESGEGITKSVQYALEKIGKPEPDLDAPRVFVGPPLLEQFMKYADLDRETAQTGGCLLQGAVFHDWNL